MILNVTPVRGLRPRQLISPTFYGEIWDHPMTPYALGGALFWMGVGNLIMRRMINFKF